MNDIAEIKKTWEAVKGSINTAFDRLLSSLSGGEATGLQAESIYPLTTPPRYFIGTKPAAVLFGEERIDVKSWRDIYAVVLMRCNSDSKGHERLMYLRNKAAGRVRLFLSDKPDAMTSPLKIDEGMYGETHYGTETLLHILCKHILDHTGFDYSGVRIILKHGGQLQ